MPPTPVPSNEIFTCAGRTKVATVLGVLTALSAILLAGFTPAASGLCRRSRADGNVPGQPSRPGYLLSAPELPLVPSAILALYLLHGMPGSPSEYLDGTELAERADEEIAGSTA